MNTLLLILLCAFEVAFAVTAGSRRCDKRDWQVGRLICSGGQLLVFLIMLIAPGIDMSFRFMGLFVLLILRIIVAFFGVLLTRKKEGERKSIAMMILSAVLSAVLISASLVPSFVITAYEGLPVTGEYEVAQASAILIDESRVEEFEMDGSKREVPVYFYYPANAAEGEKFPLVIFSHGAFGYGKSNYSTFTELASNGYTVISTEHPYHSLFTKDTAGNTITVDPSFMSGIAAINSDGVDEETVFELSSEWLELRCDDIDFVIDSVKSTAGESALPEYWHTDDMQGITSALYVTDTDTIGVMGHSLGGASAVNEGRTRNDIKAVIDLDGTMLGEITGVENGVDIVRDDPYPVPILSFDNEEHHFAAVEAEKNGEVYANNAVMGNAVCGYRTYIAGTGHMNFTDLPMYSPSLAKMLGTGSVDAEKCMMTVNGVTLGFFDSFLKGKGEFIVQECTEVS